ncbi:hypothetical protein D1641_00600 [Colidextribacter sp. OB.20]|uniref:AfsR/SARP family transcriptional regulator n=1 Tax=Colidextribacter sp. OB.20 TaxID=2304568 RepID=UPI00136EC623|nr:BTAD domain-containing putative transcriptional regulator [Colidextribacter sp. OB.20]NBI08519.1 hypothetical protein [Colidextribacter sp. OB.20]
MEPVTMQVNMLGGFSIRREDSEVTVSARSRKLCLLLACLIRERDRTVSYRELSDLLWEDQSSDPSTFNSLKAILHRARNLLDELWPEGGRALILSREGGCQWDPDLPLTVDVEEFLGLCHTLRGVQDEDRRLALGLQALALYRGDYLPALAQHPWAASQRETLLRLYLDTALDTLPLLAGQERWQEAAELSGTAFALEPCQEELCRAHMDALFHLNRRQEAAQVYEDFQERLLACRGTLPSDGLRELYRRVQRSSSSRSISPVVLLERLQELPQPGALICEFDFFRIICHSTARAAGRSGGLVHIGLLSVIGEGDSTLSQSSLKRVMDNLGDIILVHLRRGDAAARCSSSQYVLLLPQASYENSRMVCTRITRAFARQYPHSPAQLRVSVQPLPTS